MRKLIPIQLFLLLFFAHTHGQEHTISIEAQLDDKKDILKVQQKIIFVNDSDSTFTEIFLHNWANGYKNKKSPLARRLIEDYDKSLYFAKEENRGYTDIKNLTIDFENNSFQDLDDNQSDVVKVALKKPLPPGKSIEINITYDIKIPNASFTGYGKTKTGYLLRYWYLVPAVYKDGKWKIMNNLNMNDLLSNVSNYNIKLVLPKHFNLNSNLYEYKTPKGDYNEYLLVGNKKTEAVLSIDIFDNFKSFKTKDINIVTDLHLKTIDPKLSTDILNRQLLFIKQYLGKYPHKEIFIDRITQSKNPIYGLNQLPRFIRPFPDVFEWDLTMLKALSKKYIESTMLLDRRKDYWLTDGLQSYLMMEYVSKHYPEIKLAGNVAKIWGFRSFNFSKLSFNDKYPFVYQFSARQFLDQSLTTRSDSLSNFNRKIVNKYKAGLGLRYLADYIGDTIIKESFQEFYLKNNLKYSNSKEFAKIVNSKTDKNIEWFFGNYLNTSKKIDYTIKKAIEKNDSVYVTIKNKRNITAPVALYGVKKKKVKFKQWLEGIDSVKTVAIPKGDFDRVSLNYENSYPEFNSMDNWKKIGKNLLNKPVRFKLFKDIDDPYYHQIYIQPQIKYNFYDGVLIGLKTHNKPILNRNFQFTITPLYGTKSTSLNGTFVTRYVQYFEDSKINRIIYSLSGSNLHYTEDLSYNTFNQSVTVQFRRKSLRDVGSSFLQARLLNINRELEEGSTRTDSDKYSIFKLRYFYNKPDIIKGFQYSIGTEIGSEYSKAIGEVRYRKLTAKNRQLDFRIYAGAFLTNKTDSDFFSFGLDRANDYLFELNYIGRSESSGLFSQQFLLAEGGFKSKLEERFANQFMVSFNSSIGLWRWLELYNDVAFLKNRDRKVFFGYENGIRFNFINNIFEFYFPLYSNNGWEINQSAYAEKIRFVLQLNPRAIFNFFRRGFL
ncbi:aminopeptidase [Pseudotenacibaculum sp. MALMAid0570]|uniref:aminopeptidase n=1 Tax=Pseudotenacibaculum sp. MALMAid0570 TaxID=3143938 RepID=UPI0032DEA0DD